MSRPRLLIVVLLVCSIACAPVRSTLTLTPSLTWSVQPLQINGQNFCTTFSINEREGYWMTAAHCVEAGAMMGMMFGGEMSIGGYPAQVVYVDDEYDMAVLHSYYKAPALPLAPHAPVVGEAISVKGFPYGLPQHVEVQGYMAARMLPIEGKHPSDVLDLTVAGGNSGSPVLYRGHVIGVLWGRFINSEHALSVPREALESVSIYWQ